MVAPHPTQDAPRQPALDAATASTPLDKRAAAYERKKARAEYFFQLMRDPATNTIPDKIRQRELAYARTLPSYDAGAFKAAGALELNWREAGPNNVGGRTRGLGVDVANTQNVIAGGGVGVRLLVPIVSMLRFDIGWGQTGVGARIHVGGFEKSEMARRRVR